MALRRSVPPFVFVAALAAAYCSSLAAAPEYKPLQGQYAVAGKTLIDPPDAEAKDTHAYFELDGSAARDLWRALKVKAQADACGDPGDRVKRSGGLQCSESAGAKDYHCRFGIELGTARVVDGGAC